MYLKLFETVIVLVNISNYFSENTAGVIVIFNRRTDYENYDEQTAEPEAMKLDGPDELAAILDDICATIGQLLVTNAELKESMVGDGATNQASEKLEKLRKDTLLAKERLADLKDRQQHKKELERQRKANERQPAKAKQTEGKSSGMLTLRAATGRVIGYIRVMGKDQTDFFSASGKLVAREVGNLTYSNGKAVYRGKLGLVVLGSKLSS